MVTRISGVYAIVNRLNGKAYIGSSNHVQERWSTHRLDLRLGRHHSSHLQRAWHKYGADTFDFIVLEDGVVEADLFDREQWYMDQRFARVGSIEYNICPKAGTVRGALLTPEARARLLAGLEHGRGRPLTEAERHALLEASAQARRGKPLSAEHRAKIGNAHKGREYSEAQVRGLREKHEARKGTHHPESTRAAMRAAWERRKQRPMSEKRKAAYERMRDRSLTASQREAFATQWNRKGQPVSEKRLASARAALAKTPTHRKAAAPTSSSTQPSLFPPDASA
jgi:group I intron endonuclease